MAWFLFAVSLNQGSELRLSAKAPSEGYVPEFSKGLSHTPGNGWKDNERDGNKEQNYYFRVRTVLDEQGNVKSALYGKIYGDFALDPINSKTTWILFHILPQSRTKFSQRRIRSETEFIQKLETR